MFANSVDPDETACNKPSHQDLQSAIPFANNGCVQIQIRKKPLHKFEVKGFREVLQ